MTEFILAVIARIGKYVEAHPDHVHEVSQIFRSVTNKRLTHDVFCAAEQSIIKGVLH
jgi:hypothetical protein